MHILKVESYVLVSGQHWDLRLKHSISDNSERLLPRGKGGSQAKERTQGGGRICPTCVSQGLTASSDGTS